MPTKTMHVIPDKVNGRWMVIQAGPCVLGSFISRKDATIEAKRLIKGKPGQVVVLTKENKIVSADSNGLPKIQRAAVRGKVGRRALEKAVSTVVKARLTPA